VETDFLITGAKIISAILAAFLGTIGVMFNHKLDNGQLTFWGKFIIFGVIISSFVHIIGSIAEAQKYISDSRAQFAATQETLHEISRTIQPITQMRMYFHIHLPSEIESIRNLSSTIGNWYLNHPLIPPGQGIH
jgi:hypothetical protein